MENTQAETMDFNKIVEEMKLRRKTKDALGTISRMEIIGFEPLATDIYVKNKEIFDAFSKKVGEYSKATRHLVSNALHVTFEYNPETKKFEIEWVEIEPLSIKEFKSAKAANKSFDASEYQGFIKQFGKKDFVHYEIPIKKDSEEELQPNKMISYSVEEFVAKYKVLLDASGVTEQTYKYVQFCEEKYADYQKHLQ